MLKKAQRADKKLMEQIWKEGWFVATPNLTFKYIKIKSPSLPGPQISFIAPKAVSKSATKRNLLKRRGYRAISSKLSSFHGFAGAFMFGKKSLEIFGGRKNKQNNPLQLLASEIEIILQKLKR